MKTRNATMRIINFKKDTVQDVSLELEGYEPIAIEWFDNYAILIY